MPTIFISEQTAAELRLALGAAPAPGDTSPPVIVIPPVTAPPGVRIIDVPFGYVSGLQHANIPANGSVAFRFTVPVGFTSNGKFCMFTTAPTGGNDYFFRQSGFSDKPGDFTGGAVGPVGALMAQSNEVTYGRFTVGGHAMVGRLAPQPDLSKPDLVAGKTYFFNVRQTEADLSCNVNYALSVSK